MTPQIRSIVRTNPHFLNPLGPMPPRFPIRSGELVGPDYIANYEFHALWYDLFYDPSGTMVVASAPPLCNLSEALVQAGGEFRCGGEPQAFVTVPMNRCAEFWIDVENAREPTLTFSGKGISWEGVPGSNHCGWFAGRRALVTMSKNNDLEWIRDWLSLNVRAHGADAVLLYDNGSSAYSLESLLEVMAGVPGIDVAVVVDWPFKYGPQGPPWDSDFCQYAALQHARWRFLSAARCVLNSDVDEWVVTPDGKPLFGFCEDSPGGVLAFYGRWCYVPERAAGGPLWRHRHHSHYRPSEDLCPPKWVAVPASIPEDAQWRVHFIAGGPEPVIVPGILYRHFRRVSNSWKYRRDQLLPADDPATALVDEELLAAFARVEEGLDWCSPAS